MVKQPRRRPTRAAPPPDAAPPLPAAPQTGIMPLPTANPSEGGTGRFVILIEAGEAGAASQALDDSAGLRLASVGGSDDARLGEGLMPAGEGIVFHELGVAVINAHPDQLAAVSATVAATACLHLMEPERYVYAIGTVDLAYLRGYRDAVNHLYDGMVAPDGGSTAAAALGFDEAQLSWGLQAVNAGNSRWTGAGVKIAVLDTGLDLAHPDFIGRTIQSRSFIEGQTVQDGNGHGTHCCGVACGPRRPQRLPRFGVATEADLYVGKVLNDAGRGADANIFAGLQWAISNGCAVISMSLGGPVQANQTFSPIYQQIAERALAQGSLIVAAAGNNSDRTQGRVSPVSFPANCPGIMAVGAVDRRLAPGWFSNAGINPDGGKVDIVGPGVDVVSDWPAPTLYKSENGTSMATPHVAGIAALFAQANPQARGLELWARLTQRAKPLSGESRDVGAGLVQAP